MDGPALEVRGASLAFGGVRALSNVSLSVARGSITAVIGPNGAGKTSLFNAVSGFYKLDSGSILFEGQNIALFRGMTVLDNIKLGRHAHMETSLLDALVYVGRARREEAALRAEVEEKIIDFLEIDHIRKRPVASLPYGLCKRVELARALAMRPRLLMLDEPVAGMNREETEDTGYKVDASVAVFNKLTSQEKLSFYYGDSTGFSKTINPELERRGTMLMAGASLASELNDPKKYPLQFLSGPDYSEMFGILLGYIAKERPGARVAFVYGYFPRLYERRTGRAGYLSGGEQQMLAIGRALVAQPRLILLDEPSLGLSPKLVEEIFTIIARINLEQHVSMLLVEQNAALAFAVASYGYIMETGKIVIDGPVERLRRDQDVREFYLGVGGADGGARSYRDVKHYKRRKRWLS